MAVKTVAERVAELDWNAVAAALREHGYARTGRLLSAGECRSLVRSYADDAAFRTRVDMERHTFGRGSYAYFAAPLPPLVAALREGLYVGLAPLANRMMAELGRTLRYPDDLAGFARRCRRAGQSKPTPLILAYGAGGYNRLHRDLYGELHFPLQVAVMLSEHGRDYTGGELLLVENRPRQQAIGSAISLARGEAVVFPVYERPVAGKRGMLRANVRHGVSRVHEGQRYVLGVIFHDAA